MQPVQVQPPQNPPPQPQTSSHKWWEIMVIFLIIAILLAIAIPTFLGARDSANARINNSRLTVHQGALVVAATTTPKPTATRTPTPVVNVSMSPSSKSQSCTGTQALPGWILTINNTRSNVPENWAVRISNNEPNTATLWATASRSNGTAPAGGISTVTITPAADICGKIGYSGPPFTGKVTVTWPISGGSRFVTVTDTISGPIIG